MVVSIVQSNYVPWKGYFDLIQQSDVFVLYDSVQFTRRDWRNRNLIKTASGLTWITIPVEVKGQYLAPIREIRISGSGWAAQHLSTIRHAYARAPYFKDIFPWLESVFLEAASIPMLSDVNAFLLKSMCNRLGIQTRIVSDLDYPPEGSKSDALLSVLNQIDGATDYLSGPAAKSYLDEALFKQAGYSVRWMAYDGYPEYPQLNPPFEHGVSIIDVLMNTGPAATAHITRKST